jgi:hypothetical protein
LPWMCQVKTRSGGITLLPQMMNRKGHQGRQGQKE